MASIWRTANLIIHQLAMRRFSAISSIEGFRAGGPVAPRLGRCWGFGDDAMSNSPNRHSLRRINVNAKYSGRKRAKLGPDGGQFPDCRIVGDMAPSNALADRPTGGRSLIHYIGAWGDRVVTFGSDGGVRLLREAAARGEDGASNVAPRIWARRYTARAQ